MPLPTLYLKGNLEYTGYGDKQDVLDEHVPLDYIMEWFRTRRERPTSIADRILILQSSTGSGKSTAIPPEYYHLFFDNRDIAVTQPRIINAQTLPLTIIPHHTAEALAKNGQGSRKPLKMLDNIGTQTGAIKKKPVRGIIYMTIGVISAQIKIMKPEDFMRKYSVVFVDEAHERSMYTDQLLWNLKKFVIDHHTNPQCPFLVVMSATFDTKKYCDYLLESIPAPSRYLNIIRVKGMSHPIEEHFADNDVANYPVQAANTAMMLHKKYPPRDGSLSLKDDEDIFRDILIFLPGASEIRKCRKAIENQMQELPRDNLPLVIEITGETVGDSEDYELLFKDINKIKMPAGGRKKVGGDESVGHPQPDLSDIEISSAKWREVNRATSKLEKYDTAYDEKRVDELEKYDTANEEKRALGGAERKRSKKIKARAANEEKHADKLDAELVAREFEGIGFKDNIVFGRAEIDYPDYNVVDSRRIDGGWEAKRGDKGGDKGGKRGEWKDKRGDGKHDGKWKDKRGDGGTVTPVRRIILGTNTVETGVTIETLRFVVDCGFYKTTEYNPNFNVNTFVTKPVAQSMYKQRRGRVGRKAPGICYAMYTKPSFDALLEDQYPDIIRNDVTLDLLNFIVKSAAAAREANGSENGARYNQDLYKLDLLDLPSADSMHSSLEKLYILGAINADCSPTAVGEVMNKIGYMGIYSMRMVFAGYAWDASIIDLITMACFVEVERDKFIMDEKAYDMARRSGEFTLFGGGVPGERDGGFGDTKTSLLVQDEMIEYLIIMSRMKYIESDASAWCRKCGLNYRQLVTSLEERDDYINMFASVGLNPYKNFDKSLDAAITSEEKFDRVCRLKQCLYEGFRLNLAIYAPGLRQYVIDKTKMPITIESKLISWDRPPHYILFTDLLVRPAMDMPVYEPNVRNICVLDGFVTVDNYFDLPVPQRDEGANE